MGMNPARCLEDLKLGMIFDGTGMEAEKDILPYIKDEAIRQ